MHNFSRIHTTDTWGGFTLVELVVAVVIIFILGTIGLVTFTGYGSTSRDSVRIEDLSNIQKSLAIYTTTTGNRYPLPDNGVRVYSGGTLLQTQGYAGKNILTVAKFNGAGQDPLDNVYYTYSVYSTQTGMQLMAYLENQNNLTLTSYNDTIQKNTVYADNANYAIRYPMVR